MSDPRLTELLDRAVHHAPQMHLSGEELLAAGKGRVRRRRAVGLGGVLGAVALAAAVWGGLAGAEGSLLGTTEIEPAGTVWQQGSSVDGTLFAGFQTIDDGQVAHDYHAELSRPSSEGPVTLSLSDNGAVVEEIPAESPVPGLEVFAGERMTVAVWVEPPGVVASVPLVGPRDPGGPSDVQHADVGGTTVAFSVWAGDVVPLPEQVADVYLVGRDGAVSLSGADVQSASVRVAGHVARAFADVSRGVVGYAASDEGLVLEPLGDRPAQVSSFSSVAQDGVEATVAVLPEEAEIEGLAGAGAEGAEWAATRLGGRPVVLVVRDTDRPAGAHPGVSFTLGGEEHTLDGYLEDLATLHLDDGSAFSVDTGSATDEDVALRRHTDGQRNPVATAGAPLAGETVDGSLVAVVTGWDGGPTVLAHSRVEVSDGTTSRWVTPTDVAQVPRDDGTLVTVLSVPAEVGVTVTGVGRQVGAQVERWEPEIPTGAVP